MAEDPSSARARRTSLSPKRAGTSAAVGVTTADPASPGAAAAPLGHSFRRAMTVDDPMSTATSKAELRRRPGFGGRDGSFSGPPRRRSSTVSNFSDYSLSEARDILSPHAGSRDTMQETHGGSTWASLSLASALLPAVGGIFIKDGSALVTDVMLLVLAAVFLHWSVTQPWMWYYSAQELRVKEDLAADVVFDEESEGEGLDKSTELPKPKLEDVPEENDSVSPPPPKEKMPKETRHSKARQAAVSELYMHEVLALVSCFACPLLAAYLLHAIRSQLSRPSEGLVSNYNLTIFLLASEIRPLSHLLTLVQSRTLHLQRVVSANPQRQGTITSAQLGEVLQRLDQLESRVSAGELTSSQNGGHADAGRSKQEATMVREVRNAIQPELDALNRAVRRYEKKATVLAFQTESRLGTLDMRLDDAIALAAAAAKNSNSQWNVFGWVLNRAAVGILLPFRALAALLYLPFYTIMSLLGASSKTSGEKSQRLPRTGKVQPPQGKANTDRPPTRLSKR